MPPAPPHYYPHSTYAPGPHNPYGTPSGPGMAPSAPAPDPATLEAFRKNWEYYSRNPTEMEKLRVVNPTQHQTLMQYYQMYSQYLPTVSEVDRPPSRSSLQSGKKDFKQDFHQLSPSHRPESREGKEMSSIYPQDGDINNVYQPTLEGSAAFEHDQEVQKYTSEGAVQGQENYDPSRYK